MQGQSTPTKSTPTKAPELMKKKSVTSVTLEDFTIKYTLGRGAYGDVYLVEKNSDKKLYAMKQIQKRKLQKQKKQYQALVQKQMLSVLKHPAIIKLRYAFQDKKGLYFILEWCEGGEFLQFIKLNLNSLNDEIKRFYIAQIVNILEYLHKNGITHRDVKVLFNLMKPENLMLSDKGHLKIIDFGTAQISKCTLVSNAFKQKIEKMKDKKQSSSENSQEQQIQEPQSPKKKQRRSTFVGTCYYVSPQLVEFNYCPPEADLWALGCILYQLYYLQSPFKDHYEFAVYEKIKKCQIQFPPNKQISQEAIDLIKKLLKKNPEERLGSGKTQELTYQKLKQHPYFKGLNVDKVFQMPVPQIQELKQPQLPNDKKQKIQEKHQKTRTEFSKQMIQKLSSITENHKERKVLIHGLVEKKTFIKYSFYYLIIYDDLSIQRIKSEETDKVKFLKIDLSQKQSPAIFIEDSKFQLITTEKKYSLKCNKDAKKWVSAINSKFAQIKNSR